MVLSGACWAQPQSPGRAGGPLPSPAGAVQGAAPLPPVSATEPCVSAEVSPRDELTAPVLDSHSPLDRQPLRARLLVFTSTCRTWRRWTPRPDPLRTGSSGQPFTAAQRSGLEASLPPRPHGGSTDAKTGLWPGTTPPPQQGAGPGEGAPAPQAASAAACLLAARTLQWS